MQVVESFDMRLWIWTIIKQTCLFLVVRSALRLEEL